jgi:hypothetical protein
LIVRSVARDRRLASAAAQIARDQREVGGLDGRLGRRLAGMDVDPAAGERGAAEDARQHAERTREA